MKAFVRAGSNLRFLQDLPEDRFKLSVGDILVDHTVYRALSSCDRMYHVAANFKYWDRSPERILDPAIEGTKAVLRAAEQRGLKKIVVTSSVAALGVSSQPEPMDESHEFNVSDPDPYTEAKYRAEQVALERIEDGLPIVIVEPSTIFGPGDYKPTPAGAQIVNYLKMSPSVRVPVTESGISVADVDDVVEGHIAAMERGEIGERYILGGENVTLTQFVETLCDITGLAMPGKPQSLGTALLIATALELKAKWFGGEPLLTRKVVKTYGASYSWVSSEKAEKELGYQHRDARETLTRAVRWYLQNGYVPEKAAQRVRLELRPV